MLLDMPSGLQVEARKIKGSEAIDLAEKSKGAIGASDLANLLHACSVTTVDPGPYSWIDPDHPDVKFDWTRIAMDDVDAGLIQLRIGSVKNGERYSYTMFCAACEKYFPCGISLAKLPFRRMPASTLEVLRTDGFFKHTLSTGQVVSYKLATVKDNDPFKRFMKQLKRRTVTPVDRAAFAAREIDGKRLDPAKRLELFMDLPYDDANEFVAALEAAGGGYDTTVIAKCDTCGRPQTVNLPFGPSFFNPHVTPESMGLDPEPEPTAESDST